MIPNKVKVAGLEYDVQIKEIVEINRNNNYMGACDYDNSIIEVKSGLSEQRRDETFVHELTHAIFEQAGYDEQDEDMINRVGKVLYQVLKDNKLHFGRE